jgi:hypothetical protein
MKGRRFPHGYSWSVRLLIAAAFLLGAYLLFTLSSGSDQDSVIRSASPVATPPTAADASPVQAANNDGCPPAPQDVLSAVAQQPAEGILVLDLPRGVLLPLSDGNGSVLVAQVDFEDEYGVRDPVLARWFVDGRQVLTYDEAAAGVTDWPPGSFVGVDTADTMAVEYCAEQMGVMW